MLVDLVLRWIHVLAAAVLVGGSIFMRYPYLAALQATQPTAPLAEEVRRRWAILVMASSGLLLLSGLTNFVNILRRYEIADTFPGSVYQMVFGIKFLLALGVFFLASALAGRSPLAERLRRREVTWLTVNVVLAVAVVLLGGLLKLAPRTEKSSSFLSRVPSVAGNAISVSGEAEDASDTAHD
jgi:uncharacterized membrane protein